MKLLLGSLNGKRNSIMPGTHLRKAMSNAPWCVGPESFSGLPGMILGVVLPHQHITAVNLKNIPAATIVPPAQGSKVTLRELQTMLGTKVAPLDARWNEYIYQYLL